MALQGDIPTAVFYPSIFADYHLHTEHTSTHLHAHKTYSYIHTPTCTENMHREHAQRTDTPTYTQNTPTCTPTCTRGQTEHTQKPIWTHRQTNNAVKFTHKGKKLGLRERIVV